MHDWSDAEAFCIPKMSLDAEAYKIRKCNNAVVLPGNCCCAATYLAPRPLKASPRPVQQHQGSIISGILLGFRQMNESEAPLWIKIAAGSPHVLLWLLWYCLVTVAALRHAGQRVSPRPLKASPRPFQQHQGSIISGILMGFRQMRMKVRPLCGQKMQRAVYACHADLIGFEPAW